MNYTATFKLNEWTTYKILPRNLIGVYSVENTTTGEAYYGTSANLIRRWWCHNHFLNKGEHGNDLLQSAYDRNPENWIFKVLCTVDNTDELLDLEYLYGIKHDFDLLLNHRLGTVNVKKAENPRCISKKKSLRARNSVPRWADFQRTTVHMQ